jgi:hypothetical protein
MSHWTCVPVLPSECVPVSLGPFPSVPPCETGSVCPDTVVLGVDFPSLFYPTVLFAHRSSHGRTEHQDRQISPSALRHVVLWHILVSSCMSALLFFLPEGRPCGTFMFAVFGVFPVPPATTHNDNPLDRLSSVPCLLGAHALLKNDGMEPFTFPPAYFRFRAYDTPSLVSTCKEIGPHKCLPMMFLRAVESCVLPAIAFVPLGCIGYGLFGPTLFKGDLPKMPESLFNLRPARLCQVCAQGCL